MPDPLQHALGKLAQLHAARHLQTHPVQHLLDFAAPLLRLHAGKLRIVFQQFAGSQIIVEIRLLGQESDLRLYLRIVPLLAQDARLAAQWGRPGPSSSFKVVVLPAPFGPRKPKISPSSTRQMKRF